ncbi:MAG: CBS domain-containing protein [Pyrodictiaceae archaeon]
MSLRPSIPRPHPEGLRWLRSDGKPNFSDRVRRREGDAKIIARRPVHTVSKNATILAALEEMANRNIRSLVIADPGSMRLQGIVTVMDFVNYLGGGELYNIVEKRHNGIIYSALLREKVSSIMNPNPIYASIEENLPSILEKMITQQVGVIPIVYDDGRIWGIITEHDIVAEIVEKNVGRKVAEVMTRSLISAPYESRIIDVLRLMVRYGVRRIPLVDENAVKAIITAKDIVKFFGSHEVFNHVIEGSIKEVHSLPARLIASNVVVTIDADADVGEAATLMMRKGVSSLIVTDSSGNVVGIVTERDILYGLATSR